MIGRTSLVLALALFCSEVAFSCSCGGDSTVSPATVEFYDSIFEGEVLQLRLVETPTGGGQPAWVHDQAMHVVLRVLKGWKGVEKTVVNVVTHPQSTACGFPFAVGESFLVFARLDEAQTLRVSLCGHSRVSSERDPAYEVLGPPKVSFDTVFATSAFWKE